MTVVKIGIVGAGPRGLSALERVLAFGLNHPERALKITLFDPSMAGPGCHHIHQPDYLLVNTIAEQITMFADESVKQAGAVIQGPNFYQWLSSLTPEEGRPENLRVDGYYSRRLFGRYLNWVFLYLQDLAPANVQIVHQQCEVVDIERHQDAWVVMDELGERHHQHRLVLATGHTKPKAEQPQHDLVIEDPYPVDTQLQGITPDMTVAIQGMGLTMCDVVAELTEGRGGQFVRSPVDKSLRYLASGQEPKLMAFSRSGLPLTGRAANQKHENQQYQGRFLTFEAVEQLRQQGQIDFVNELFPLLWLDMEYAYYHAYLKEKQGVIAAQRFANEFLFSDASGRQALIRSRIPATDQLSWQDMVSPIPQSVLASPQQFDHWLMAYLREDLHQANKGNVDSAFKAACDVLRDLRDPIRNAIDFAGLTPESQRWFNLSFVPVMNRIAVGPPKERIEQMLALIDAGILRINLGPDVLFETSSDGAKLNLHSARWPEARHQVDRLVKAKIAMPTPGQDQPPLWRNLIRRGYARPFYNRDYHPGGIEVTCDLQLVDGNGRPVPDMWALGMPTEGSKFYTFIVPRPGVNSTAIVDAGRVVAQMMAVKSSQPEEAMA